MKSSRNSVMAFVSLLAVLAPVAAMASSTPDIEITEILPNVHRTAPPHARRAVHMSRHRSFHRGAVVATKPAVKAGATTLVTVSPATSPVAAASTPAVAPSAAATTPNVTPASPLSSPTASAVQPSGGAGAGDATSAIEPQEKVTTSSTGDAGEDGVGNSSRDDRTPRNVTQDSGRR